MSLHLTSRPLSRHDGWVVGDVRVVYVSNCTTTTPTTPTILTICTNTDGAQ
jgi:hypothetical protein